MALLRKLFWFAIFVIATLGFVVLFENGTVNYVDNFTRKVEVIQKSTKKFFSPSGGAQSGE